MSLQAPQQIRLRRRLGERQIGLLYLPSDAPYDLSGPTGAPPKTRRVFKLVKRDAAAAAAVIPKLEPRQPDGEQGPQPVRFVLTQSEPSRKRKIATFTAERPAKKKLLAQDGSQVAVEPPPPPPSQPSQPSMPHLKRPGASTATSKPSARGEHNGRVAGGQAAPKVGEDEAFKKLLDEAESEGAPPAVTPLPPPPPAATRHRFLPKATTRLKDRRSTSVAATDSDAMDVDTGGEPEYVYDTYILDDAMDFDMQSAEPGTVGVLHIDEDQQPIWETYLDETDSDDEHASDDEDSNAEDYHGADYPEDELDSDDEYDLDVYKYRRGASDDEEYGPDDAAYSDDEGQTGVPQWLNNRH